MKKKHRKLDEQVIVITGASSGVGLTTAQMAAERGAKVVVVARSEEKLSQVVGELRGAGHEAIFVVADVADADAVEQAAQTAVDTFGGIDTWINVAAQGLYGRLEELDVDDARRLFDINYFGQVNGAKAALPRLRACGGGAIINIGSVVSDRAMPLIGHYSATKHAIKAFTDALRMELEHDDEPISVTLIKPGSINTPFVTHAKSLLVTEPNYPPPVYEPEVVARAILEAVERPIRELYVGAGGKMIGAMHAISPRLTDRYMERSMFDQQRSDRMDLHPEGSLYAPVDDEPPRRHGPYLGHVAKTSLYTQAVNHPWLALGMALAGTATAAWLMDRQG